MPETISDPQELRALCSEHLHRSGKFFQMFEGTSSELTLYENGILHLEIRTPGRGRFPVEQLARNIAKSWAYGPKLSGATGYVVQVYKANSPSGFFVDAKGIEVKELAAIIRAQIEAAKRPRSDILLTVVEGNFSDDS